LQHLHNIVYIIISELDSEDVAEYDEGVLICSFLISSFEVVLQ